MTCRHCREPIQRCNGPRDHRCAGYTHARDGMHLCRTLAEPVAQPEPGTLPAVETPASKPRGEVA